ncbi:hypothetical protein CO154_01295 [Candidatus Pacearchaeota archaeon CG_4_9_14_3_um_filter_31_7]|nr:MAG: hypothetical protein AUJ10_02325 [Candidatus Pacearchaeota archaeon CG1_02_31_27]PIN92513.1 MAG: hypothetical protein COU55_01780 [Candidatus Pacearchaeota archaeon CG10_big_fil_rev_8_21_14_0_10_31_59]PIZ80828.1 MAG: hypothetical protein COX99_01600 [Candidatus Pacearchaeota archaeon CG_4_10_14_0_2_um_filter_31_10]PJA70740.1 MAG: hypothetical protein CO154_01295 [Candidatus Pacearchaeota archaeon CG_4_9_14_3_um_filter_31_7]
MNYEKEIEQLDLFFKTKEWIQVLKESFNYEDKSFSTKKSFLSLTLVRSKIFGDRLISIPFTGNMGGLINNKELDIEIKSFFCSSKYPILIKTISPNKNYPNQMITEDKQFLLNIKPNKEKIFNNINKKVRNIIRKTENNNFEFEVCKNKKAINDLYEMHIKKIKEFGSFPFPKKFFINLLKIYEDKANIVSCLYKKKRIASFLILKKDKIAVWYTAVSLEKYKNLNPTTWLLWKTILWLKEDKYEFLNLGASSKNSGTYEFKKKLNPIILDTYEVIIGTNKKINASKKNSIKKLWKKMPPFIIKIFGPFITKNLG